MKLEDLPAKADALARQAESRARLAVPFAILTALFLAFYLGEMTSFTVSIDEEDAALRIHPISWVFQGRWTMSLLELVISQPVVPYFPLMLFGICSAAAYLMTTASFRFNSDGLVFYLLFFLFCGFPTLFFILDFTGNTSGLALGLLLSSGSMLIFSSMLGTGTAGFLGSAPKVMKAVGQIVLTTAAIGCYQSFALFILFGYCGIFVVDMIFRQKYTTRHVITCNLYIALIFATSMAVNHLIFLAAMALWPGEQPGYVLAFARFDMLADSPLEIFAASLRHYRDVYLGAPDVYGFRYFTFPFLIAAGIAGLVWKSRDGGAAAAVFVLVYLVGMTYVPFAFHLFSGGGLPYRTLVAIPLAFWFFAAAAAWSGGRGLRLIAVALSAIVALQSLYTLSALQAARRLVYQHDVDLASRVYDRIALQTDDFDRRKNYAVDIFGAYEFRSIYPQVQTSTWGASFFEWEGGNPARIVKFMRVLGYDNLNAMTEKSRQAFLPDMLEMPVWPHEGSVRVFGNKALVRLGETPGLLHKKLMPAAPAEDAGEILFDLADAPADKVTVQNAEVVSRDEGKLHLAPGNDAMILFSTGRPDELRKCRELSIRAFIFTREDDTAQLFFLPAGAPDFTEANSVQLEISQGNPIEFNIVSETGFEDRLRLDPTYVPAEVVVENLTVRCGQLSAGR